MKKSSRQIVGRLFIVLVLMLALVFGIQAQAASRKISKISLTNVTNNKITMITGKTYSLKVSITPKSATNKKVAYSSSNKLVATVSSTGTITAKKAGTVTVTVRGTDGSNVQKKITVTVKDKSKVIQKISLPTYKTQKLLVGETYTLKPQIAPVKYKDRGVSYTSSNTKVIKVTASGKITAIAAGSATVTVKAKDTDMVSTKIKFTVKTYGQLKVKSSQSVAHMGLIYEAPSNSVPSFIKAATSKAFMGIETDVRETKDGAFVLIHDADISSRTNGSGLVSRLTIGEVKSAVMNRGTNISQYKNLRIPRLEEYLEVCKKYEMTPVLHIKEVRNYKRLLSLLDEYGLKEKAIITGSKATMLKFRSIDKKVTLYWIGYFTKSNIQWASKNNVNLNVSYGEVTQELCDYAQQKDVKVGAWTVNNYNTAKRVLYKGVDFITGDYKFTLYK